MALHLCFLGYHLFDFQFGRFYGDFLSFFLMLVLKNYLASKLENSCLAWWEKYEASSKCKIKLALCKLAKQFLTPPPTSTNCERLFSVAGQIMDEKRANLLPENLEKILFLRENI